MHVPGACHVNGQVMARVDKAYGAANLLMSSAATSAMTVPSLFRWLMQGPTPMAHSESCTCASVSPSLWYSVKHGMWQHLL